MINIKNQPALFCPLYLSKTKTFFVWLLILIPFVTYALCIIKYAVNVPYMDDFDAALNFVNLFIKLNGPVEKIKFIFAQHNEHRIVLDRIVFLGCYYLFGEINFIYSIMLGNLGWFFFVITFIYYLKSKYDLPLVAIIPIPYLLLSFSHWENMFFSMAAIQNYWFLFFTLIFIICLTENKPYLYCSLFTIALFTSGGGVVLYLVGNFYLAVQKKWCYLKLFFIISSSSMILYFYDYVSPPNHPSLFDSLLFPLRTLKFFFTFLGNIGTISFFSVIPSYAALILGIAIFILTISLSSRIHNSDTFFILVLNFILLIALLSSLSRSAFGVNQALAPRYSVYPLIALACIYASSIRSISQAIVARQAIVWAAILFGMSCWAINLVDKEMTIFPIYKNYRIASIEAYNSGSDGLLYRLYPDRHNASLILETSQSLGIYKYQANP